MKQRLAGYLVSCLPKNHLSQLVGWLVHRELPGAVGRWSVRSFAKYYGMHLEEAEKSVDEYASIGDLFVRRLKSSARPITEAFACHPCDSHITQFGRIDEDNLIQAKGKHYTATELLGDSELAHRLAGGHYFTYYLCPTDYHRVHSPVAGKILRSIHLPGKLWPVNGWSVDAVPNLFSINERVVTAIETERGLVTVVLVGATNVGRIEMCYDPSLVTNQKDSRKRREKTYQPPLPIGRGDELGVFHMGSTVILLVEKNVMNFSQPDPRGQTRMGEPLGT